MLKPLIVAALAVTVASPAIGQAMAPNSAPAAASKAKDPKRKICEAVEETGSRLSSKRICLTAEQWEAQRGGDQARRSDKASGAAGGN